MKKTNKKSGQTLVEALVGIGILAVVFTIAFSFISLCAKTARANKNRMAAISYAQDAIEKIRNIRDSNLKNGNNFALGIAAEDSTEISVNILPSSDPDQNFKINPSSFPENKDDVFFRTTKISRGQEPVADEITISVEVTWEQGANFKVSEVLTNWKN